MRNFILLDESGALAHYRKTELIDGDIYFVTAQYRPHALVKTELHEALRDAFRAINSSARPIAAASLALSDTSLPEPDVTLTSEPRGSGPIPLVSVPLIVELSDSTLDMDLGR